MTDRSSGAGRGFGTDVAAAVADAPPVARVVLIAGAAALGGFLFGFDTAVINGAVGAIKDWSHAGDVLLGFSVASALLGSAIGAWFAGPLADRHGCIAVMQIAAVLFFVSGIGTGLPWDIWSLTFFRITGGLAVGAASVIAPAYIAEVSPAYLRGRLGSLQQMAIVVGIFVALLVDYALAEAPGGAVGSEFCRLPDIPHAGRCRAWPGLRHLCAMALLSFVFVLRLVRETRGQELEAME